ncbi:MAG: hypothetical protein GX319_04535 [Clostridiales bacterium]|jgi:Flp pilus assembly pilin Flp|nr:Flp1 family type IVb pilin [Bacillota bacterium]NLK03663.1 hypothetical protein [Clostridiales bacterium]
MKKKIKKLIRMEVEGIGVVEIVLILLVLIGLVVIFRDQINNIISSVFDSINDAVDTF